MTWGDTFNRHKATGMDPSAAAFIADRSEPMRKRRAEVDNERLREALVQADLTIRSFPGTDQSDVEFIRIALAGASTGTNVASHRQQSNPVVSQKSENLQDNDAISAIGGDHG